MFIMAKGKSGGKRANRASAANGDKQTFGNMIVKYMESKGVTDISVTNSSISGTLTRRVSYRDYKNGVVEGNTVNGTYDATSKTIEIKNKIVIAISEKTRNLDCKSINDVPDMIRKNLDTFSRNAGNFSLIE